MGGIDCSEGNPHHMTKCDLTAEPRLVDEYHHRPGDMERWEGTKLQRRRGVDAVEEGAPQHPVQSKKAGFARVLVDDVAVAINDGAVREPRWGGGEEGLDEDSGEVHPAATPHVRIQLSSLCRHHGKVGTEHKR